MNRTKKEKVSMIRQARLERGLTIADVCKIVDVNPGGMSRVERGQMIPGLTVARRLGKLYGLTLDEVYSHL